MTKPAPSPSAPKLPVSLAANPTLSSWLRFSPEGHVKVSPGKVEIGQGIVTALAQIAADELDLDIGRVQMVRASTAASPNEGVTSGSLSVQQSGRAIRHVCAEVRQIFLGLARSPSMTAPSPDPAMSGPATGNWPMKFRWSATRRRALCRNDRRSARLQGIPLLASIFPTRFSRILASFTIPRCPGCCMAACCDRSCQRQDLSTCPRIARARLMAWSPSCATAISRAWSAKPRRVPKPRSTPCARVRRGQRVKRCPTKTGWRNG